MYKRKMRPQSTFYLPMYGSLSRGRGVTHQDIPAQEAGGLRSGASAHPHGKRPPHVHFERSARSATERPAPVPTDGPAQREQSGPHPPAVGLNRTGPVSDCRPHRPGKGRARSPVTGQGGTGPMPAPSSPNPTLHGFRADKPGKLGHRTAHFQ
jgi:hypothetical protein